MKKIMFNDKYGLTESVLENKKTQTRRIEGPEGSETRYAVGEIVAIAQSYQTITDNSQSDKSSAEKSYEIKQHFKDSFIKESVWGNKMFSRPEFMPYKIEITNVRRERLNDISFDDCIAEGVYELDGKYYVSGIYDKKNGLMKSFDAPMDAYSELIDRIGHKGDWNRNPEVVVYEFKLVR